MFKYIALLRGINVGGKNKISMKELKNAFEKYGFKNVKTYFNSGNVIFTSEINDEIKLKEMCEHIILDKFKLNIPVAIISAEDLSEALKNAPSWWGADEETKHNAIFVLYPKNPKDIIKEVGDIAPKYEQIGCFGQVIFWSAPVKTFSKVRWIKIVGSSAYKNVTIRNFNTTKKLLELILLSV